MFTPEELEELRIFDAQIDAEEKAKAAEAQKRSYETHGEQRRKYQRKYYIEHKEEILVKQRQKKNKDAIDARKREHNRKLKEAKQQKIA